MSRDAAAAGPLPFGRPQFVVAAVTARKATRSAVAWGAVFAVYLAASPLGYASTYPTAAARARLAATFGANAGVNALIGPAHAIDTVAGFTAWRSLGVLGLVGAVWGLLTATRLLRGEEEAGRWELLLAGAATRRTAAAQGLAGLAAGLLVLWTLPTVVLIAVGRAPSVRIPASAAAFDVLAVVCSAAVFLALGALAAQLAPTRGRAAGYSGAVLGGAYALRLVADSGTGLEWLRWTTPLGWAEELRPLTGSRPLALMPVAALTVLAGGLAVVLAGRRDLGASTVPDRATARPRTRLLIGPTSLTIRLLRPSVLGWSAAVATMGLLLGLVARSAGSALASASGAAAVLARLGARGNGATAYLGVAFLIVALLVGLVAAGQATAAREEEASGRLDHLLARPPSRVGWLSGRIAVAVSSVVLICLVAALGTWVGATSQHAGIGVGQLLGAGLNLLPPSVVVLGAGVLALGVWPRGVPIVAYGLLAWSFLVELLGSIVQASHWLLDLSLFHHMAPAPATAPDWRTDAVLLLVGAAAAVTGVVAFHRRDIVQE